MAFTEDEVAYLKSQPLARVASVGPDGQPDVTPGQFRVRRDAFLRRRLGAGADPEVPQRQGGQREGRPGRGRPGVRGPEVPPRLRDGRAGRFGKGSSARLAIDPLPGPGFRAELGNLRGVDHGPWMHRCPPAFELEDPIAAASRLSSGRLYGR